MRLDQRWPKHMIKMKPRPQSPKLLRCHPVSQVIYTEKDSLTIGRYSIISRHPRGTSQIRIFLLISERRRTNAYQLKRLRSHLALLHLMPDNTDRVNRAALSRVRIQWVEKLPTLNGKIPERITNRHALSLVIPDKSPEEK